MRTSGSRRAWRDDAARWTRMSCSQLEHAECGRANRYLPLARFAATVLPLIAIVLLFSGCDQTRQSALEQRAIRLPSKIYPQEVAIAGDGSVWMADEYHGLARRDARGQIRSYVVASNEWEEDWANDIVRGPNG